VADRFKPDVVLLSAGFDMHWRDPISNMRLSIADIADMSLEVSEIADTYCNGRLVAVQEGGYDLDVIARAAATLLINLTGSDKIVDDIGEPEPLTYRWNDQAILSALYQLHDLAGYRRKPKRPETRPGYTPPAPEQPNAE
jgi:acetoin utilization deacetylase AcuC-like enzyme